MGLSGFLKRRVKYFIKGSCWCCCGGGGMVVVVGTLGVVVSTILVVLSALTTPSSVSASAYWSDPSHYYFCDWLGHYDPAYAQDEVRLEDSRT